MAILTLAASAARAQEGGTLVVPVEFADCRFEGGRAAVEAGVADRFARLRAYYEAMSLGQDDLALRLRETVAPTVRLAGTRARYGRDRLRLARATGGGLRLLFERDAGDLGGAFAGQRALKAEALSALARERVPVSRFRYLFYVVPGKGGNRPFSRQLWPASMGGDPREIRQDAASGAPSGPWQSGILIGLDQPFWTYAHEFGHQLGLPDLYLGLARPWIDAGFAGLMGSGDRRGAAMLGIDRATPVGGDRGKSDWLGPRARTAGGPGRYRIQARTSCGETLCLRVPVPGAPAGTAYVVECFDRKGADRGLPCRGRAGVLIYRVDAATDGGLTRLEVLGPRPVIRRLLPLELRARLPGHSPVFRPGDALDLGEGVTLAVRALVVNEMGETEAVVEVTPGRDGTGDPFIALERRAVAWREGVARWAAGRLGGF